MREEDKKIKLGRKIKQIRRSMGLTQENFCNKIDLEVSNLSNIETGKYFPSIQTLMKIINELKIEPNEIFDITFYDDPEIIDNLASEYFSKMPFERKVMALKIMKLINEESKN